MNCFFSVLAQRRKDAENGVFSICLSASASLREHEKTLFIFTSGISLDIKLSLHHPAPEGRYIAPPALEHPRWIKTCDLSFWTSDAQPERSSGLKPAIIILQGALALLIYQAGHLMAGPNRKYVNSIGGKMG